MSVAFRAMACHLPSQIMANEVLVQRFPEWTDEKIFKKTGIRSRFVVKDGVSALDLAEKACLKLFAEQNFDPVAIDYLIFCTQSPEYALPPNSTLLQDRLALSKSLGCFDFTHGCSGYVYGLSLAAAVAAAGMAQNILLVTGETYSLHLNPEDKATLAIFGDGASATLLTAQSGPSAVSHCVFETDGSGAKYLFSPFGGVRGRLDGRVPLLPPEDADSTSGTLHMNGPAIFSYMLQTVPGLLERLFQKTQIHAEDVDFFVFHQANAYMLEHLRLKCKIPREKFLVDLEDTGNTVSCSIPLAISRALEKGTVRSGQLLALAGFGVGLSSAACCLRL